MKILVTTESFGKEGRACSHHIADRVRELIARGIEVTVVTEDEPTGVFAKLREKVHVHAIPKGLGRRRLRALRWFRKRCRTADCFAHWEWADAAAKWMTCNLDLRTYDVLYSTGGPASAHLAASEVARQIAGPWIAEVQDPLFFEGMETYGGTPRDKARQSSAQAAIAQCDALICLTEKCRDHYRDLLRKQTVFAIRPGAPKPDEHDTATVHAVSQHSDHIVFLHAGSFYVERNLDLFAKLLDKGGWMDRTEVRMAGRHSDIVKDFERNWPRISRYLGMLSRSAVAREAALADVCLVVQHQAPISALTIPSKLYDYGAAGTTVLFLGYRNSEARAMAEQYGFYYAEQADEEAFKTVLDQLMSASPATRRRMVRVPIEEATSCFLDVCQGAINSHAGQAG